MSTKTITFDGSNYPDCGQELAKRVQELAQKYASEKEFSIEVTGISKEDAIQFGILHSSGRQALYTPIRDSNQQVIGWNLQFVKYSA